MKVYQRYWELKRSKKRKESNKLKGCKIIMFSKMKRKSKKLHKMPIMAK